MADSNEKGTAYVVLASDNETDGWEVLGTYVAASQSAAKTKALAAQRPQGGWVVAVPGHSWKPEDKKPVLSFR